MKNISQKILFVIILVVLIWLNSFFILGQQDNNYNLSDDEITTLQEINENQAKIIALGIASGVVAEINEKTIDGLTFYEVEINDEYIETEIKINKNDGAVVQITREPKDNEEVEDEELQAIQGILTEDQAKEIALSRIHGSVIGFESEREDGRLIYEVDMISEGENVGIEIDAKTGEVLEIEWGDD